MLRLQQWARLNECTGLGTDNEGFQRERKLCRGTGTVSLRVLVLYGSAQKTFFGGKLQMGKVRFFGLVAVGQAVKQMCACVTRTHLMGGSSVSAELYLLRDSSRFPVGRQTHLAMSAVDEPPHPPPHPHFKKADAQSRTSYWPLGGSRTCHLKGHRSQKPLADPAV